MTAESDATARASGKTPSGQGAGARGSGAPGASSRRTSVGRTKPAPGGAPIFEARLTNGDDGAGPKTGTDAKGGRATGDAEVGSVGSGASEPKTASVPPQAVAAHDAGTVPAFAPIPGAVGARVVRYDTATGLSLGDRDTQEDAVLADVPIGGGAGIVVLGDGLGGHHAGALASRLAVMTAMGEIASARGADGLLDADIPELLHAAARAANAAILAVTDADPELDGMGTTLLAVVVEGDTLYWLSIGDSPLYLMREGELDQLNEVHSLATHLDLLVRVGEMKPEEAARHPGRSCLTSALGSDKIERIDCPEAPLQLEPGDVLLLASDGLLTLDHDAIAKALLAHGPEVGAAELAAHLLEDVAAQDATGQDNTSVAVLCLAAGSSARSHRAQQEAEEAARAADTHASVEAAVQAVIGLTDLFAEAEPDSAPDATADGASAAEPEAEPKALEEAIAKIADETADPDDPSTSSVEPADGHEHDDGDNHGDDDADNLFHEEQTTSGRGARGASADPGEPKDARRGKTDAPDMAEAPSRLSLGPSATDDDGSAADTEADGEADAEMRPVFETARKGGAARKVDPRARARAALRAVSDP